MPRPRPTLPPPPPRPEWRGGRDFNDRRTAVVAAGVWVELRVSEGGGNGGTLRNPPEHHRPRGQRTQRQRLHTPPALLLPLEAPTTAATATKTSRRTEAGPADRLRPRLQQHCGKETHTQHIRSPIASSEARGHRTAPCPCFPSQGFRGSDINRLLPLLPLLLHRSFRHVTGPPSPTPHAPARPGPEQSWRWPAPS